MTLLLRDDTIHATQWKRPEPNKSFGPPPEIGVRILPRPLAPLSGALFSGRFASLGRGK